MNIDMPKGKFYTTAKAELRFFGHFVMNEINHLNRFLHEKNCQQYLFE